MTTMVGIGLDDHRDGVEVGRRAARAALADLGAQPVALALLFTSHPQPERVLKGANEILGPVALIGATTGGQYTHQGYVEDGAGVLLIHSEHIHFHLMSHQRRWFSGSKLLGSLRGISEQGLGSDFSQRALLLFPDDRSMNLDSVVDRAMTETGLLYDILGGPGLTVQEPPRPPAVFHNDRMLRSGLSGAEILSQTPLGLSLANGWQPISGPYRVTRADERRIIELDGRPAREVYEDFIEAHNVEYPRGELRRLLLQHPVGSCREGGICKVSVLMGIDNHGALVTTSPPVKGTLIHILATGTDAMTTAAERAIQQSRSQLTGGPLAGALFIDCVSTGMVLGEAHAQQRAVVQQQLGDLPFLGFRSHGVLLRVQGQTTGHYECSVATCIIPC
ncbi:MAG: hypothetical protein GYB67_14140 [Chloroflexi bacterium]|nr:hypothetical protein [Chloroflexota bacterium]